jgi:glucoamylase
MYFSSSIVGLVPLLCIRVIAAPSSHLNARAPLDDFVSKESAVSLQGALNNIGPDGSEVPGAKAGFVVASPSKVDPPCKSPKPTIEFEIWTNFCQTFTLGPEIPH